MSTEPKFPAVEVALLGEDGNVRRRLHLHAFAIMGRVTREMWRAGVSSADIDAYTNEAMSGDYDHLLQVTMRTVTVK